MQRADADEPRGAVWVCGPERKSWTFHVRTGSVAVGVRFRPGILSAILAVDASTIVDRRVRLGELVGASHEVALCRRLADAKTSNDRRVELERYVADVVASSEVGGDLFVQLVLDHLAESAHASQATLAHRLGISPRQLHRRSLRAFGYGIATLARLLRFQRFLALAGLGARRSTSSLAGLAAAAGYADQAHLSRDCRAITGLSPTKFIAVWFPTFPDMSDPYKTRVPFAMSMVA